MPHPLGVRKKNKNKKTEILIQKIESFLHPEFLIFLKSLKVSL
jgi:hypothetical protein